ncbi:hypothetical protein N0V85_008417 [Neurospora sp. IMI 360204]|nr:hypothetical protein N0V85_008417 [Neurospora sp. IMI 360204]
MSFFKEGFSADSAAHPEPPTSFDSGNGSGFSWEDWFDWDAYEADIAAGVALEASQLTQGDTSPHSTSPHSTSSYATSPYGTSSHSTSTDVDHFDDKNGLGKVDVASFGDNIVMSLDNGTFPGLQPMDVDDSVDVGASNNGVPTSNGLHNSVLASPTEKARPRHKFISSALNGSMPNIAATDGFPPLNISLGASGHDDNFSYSKPNRARTCTDTHLPQTKGQVQQTGAGGFLNGEDHGSNFGPGNLPPYPNQHESHNPDSGYGNPGCTLVNSKRLENTGTNHDPKDDGVNLYETNGSFRGNFPLHQSLQDGTSHQWKSAPQTPSFPQAQKTFNSSVHNFGSKGSNGWLDHLSEFQKWVLGLDATTMLCTAQEASTKSSNVSSGGSNAARFTAPYSKISQSKHYSVSSGYNGNPTPIFPVPRASNGLNIPIQTGTFSPDFPLKVDFPNVAVKHHPSRATIVSRKICDDKGTDEDGNVGRDRHALIEWRHARGIYTCTSCCNSAVFSKRTLCKHCREQDEDGKKRCAAAAKQKAEEEKGAEQEGTVDTQATLADVATGGAGNASSGTKAFEGAAALGRVKEGRITKKAANSKKK